MKTKPYKMYAKSASISAKKMVSRIALINGFIRPDIIENWSTIATAICKYSKPINMQYNAKSQEFIITLLILDLGLWAQWKAIESSIISRLENILQKKCRIKITML